MFLTRMRLNSARRGAIKLVSSPQALHAAVLAAFANADASDDGRVLWRLDSYRHQRLVLYVASPQPPDFTHLVEQAGWPTTETWDTRDYGPLLSGLRKSQRWQFRLTANPVRSARLPGWSDTKPLAHVTADQQQKWLLDRAETNGFRAVTVNADLSETSDEEPDLAVVDRSVRNFRRAGQQVTIATATFEGHLEVADPERLRRAMTHGIGRAKAYGCGLLTLAPVVAGKPS